MQTARATRRDLLVDNLFERIERLEWSVGVLQERVVTVGSGSSERDGGAPPIPVEAPAGIIIVGYNGSVDEVPEGWQLCDGTNGTPDLQDRFIVGAGNSYAVGDMGGEDASDLGHVHGPGTLNTDSDTHNHDVTGSSGSAGSHTHGSGSYATDDDSHTHSISQIWTRDTDDTGTNAVLVTFTLANDSHNHDVTGSSASDGSHTHTSGTYAADNDSHDHDVDSGETASAGSATQENRPLFYALAWIMWMG